MGDIINHQSQSNVIPRDYYIKALKSEHNIVRSVAYQRLSCHYINNIILNNDKSEQLINDASNNADLAIKCYPFNLLAYVTRGTISFIIGNYCDVLKSVKLFKCFNKWHKLHSYNTIFRMYKKYTRENSHHSSINLNAEMLSLEAKSFLALKNPIKALNCSLKLYNILLSISNPPFCIDNINNRYKIGKGYYDDYYGRETDKKIIKNCDINVQNEHRLAHLKVESLIIASSSICEIEHQIFSSIKLNQSVYISEIKKMDRAQVESQTISFLELHKNTVEQCTTVWTCKITEQCIDFVISELQKVDCDELKPDALVWSSVLLYASGRYTEVPIVFYLGCNTWN